MCVGSWHSYTVSWLDSRCSSLIFYYAPCSYSFCLLLAEKKKSKDKMKKKEEKKEVCTFCQPEKKNIEKSNQHHFYVEFVYIIYTWYIQSLTPSWKVGRCMVGSYVVEISVICSHIIHSNLTIIFLVTNNTFRYFSLVMRWRKEMNLLTTNLHMKCTML